VQIFTGSMLSQTETARAIPESTVFNERNKLAFNRDQAYFNNVVKFDPTMLIRNIVFFGYDHYFLNDLAISIGAGYAYEFDPLLRINPSSTAIFGAVDVERYFDFSTLVNVKKKFNTGFALQLAGRRYFEKYDDFIKPPILRSSLYNFESKNKGHYTVYLSNWDESNLHQILKKINYKFEVFCNIKKPHRLNNCFFKPIEKTSFDESLKTSQGIITEAGFQTCSEALYLNKDLIAIPINNQYEQLCNVESLKRINVKVGKIEQIECMINMGFTQRPGYWQDPTDEIINEILNFRFK
jgi:hypothetical protein